MSERKEAEDMLRQLEVPNPKAPIPERQWRRTPKQLSLPLRDRKRSDNG